MAITYDNFRKVDDQGGATSITLSTSAGEIKEGQLMIAIVGKDDDVAPTGSPTGWTLLSGSSFESNNQIWQEIYYRVATTADESATDYTWSGDSETWFVHMYLVSGAGTPVLLSDSTDVGDNSTDPTTGAFTASDADSLIIAGFVNDSDSTSHSLDSALPNAGADKTHVTTGSGNGGIGGADGAYLPGTTSIPSYTHSVIPQEEWTAYVVEVPPTSSPPTIEVNNWAFYEDGNESTATIIGSINTNPTKGSIKYDAPFLVRFDIEETANAWCHNAKLKLEYRVNGGTWTTCPNTGDPATDAVSIVEAYGSGYLSDGGHTTRRLGTSYTYLAANQGIAMTENSAGSNDALSSPIHLKNNGFEGLFVVRLSSFVLQEDDTVDLRVAATPFAASVEPTSWPQITAPAADAFDIVNVQVTMPSTIDHTWDVTSPDVDGVPRAVIITATPCVVTNTPIDEGQIVIGFGSAEDPAGNYAATAFHSHNVSTTNARQYQQLNGFRLLSGTGNLDSTLQIRSFIDGGCRIDFNPSTENSWEMTFTFFMGDITVTTGSFYNNTTETQVTIGFQPDLILGISNHANDFNTLYSEATLSIGFATGSGTSITQGAIASRGENVNSTSNYQVATDSGISIIPEASGADGFETAITEINSTGFKFQSSDADEVGAVSYLALKFNDGNSVWTGFIDTITGTGTQAYTAPGFKPAFIGIVPSWLTAVDSEISSNVFTMSFGVADAHSKEMSVSMAVEDNVATTDNESLTDDSHVLRMANDAGDEATTGSLRATLSSFDASGFTLNYTHRDSAATHKMLAFAIEEVTTGTSASVDADVTAVTASAAATSIHVATVGAEITKVEASAALDRINVWQVSVDADVTAVEASANATYVHTGTAVDADAPVTEASAASRKLIKATVDAEVFPVTASAASTVHRHTSIDADVAAAEATAAATAIHVAQAAADVASVEAAAASVLRHIAAVDADVSKVESSAATKAVHIASVAALTDKVTASASGKVVKQCSVAADVLPITASVNTKVTWDFSLPLTNDLYELRRGIPPSFTRTTVATVLDQEKVIHVAKAYEARFEGARRAENLVGNLQDQGYFSFDFGTWTNVNDKDGKPSGINMSFTTTGASLNLYRRHTSFVTKENDLIVSRAAVRLNSALPTGATVKLYNGNGATASTTIADSSTGTGTWIPFSISSTVASDGSYTVGVIVATGTSSGQDIDVDIAQYQVEKLQSSTNQNPSEYIPVGIGDGTDFVTNGGFDADTDWTKLNTTISGGVANFSATIGNAAYVTQNISGSYLPNTLYVARFTVSNYVSGDIYAAVGGGSSVLAPVGANGTFNILVRTPASPTQVAAVVGNTSDASDFDIDDFSVELVENQSAGVSGVEYFNTENGNTVNGTTKVITESTGDAIPDLTLKGYLNEEQRTNYLYPSDDLSDTGSWGHLNVTGWDSTSLPTIAGLPALGVIGNTSDAIHNTYFSGLGLASDIYCGSIFAAKGDQDWIRLALVDNSAASYVRCYFNLATGELGTFEYSGSIGTYRGASIEPVDGGYICIVYGDFLTTSLETFAVCPATADQDVTFSGDASTVNSWLVGAQLELGHFPTSYIPTTTGTVTRNTDVLTYDYQPSAEPGSFAATITALGYRLTGNSITVAGNSNSRFLYLTTTGGAWSNDGSFGTEYDATFTTNRVRYGLTYEDNGTANETYTYKSGSQVTSQYLDETDGFSTGSDPLGIGCRGDTGVNPTNANIRDVNFWNIAQSQSFMEDETYLPLLASVSATTESVTASADAIAVRKAAVDATLYTRTQNNTDPYLTSETGWTLSNVSISGNQLIFSSTGGLNQYACWPGHLNVEAGKQYRVVYKISGYSSGFIKVLIGDVLGGIERSANGVYEEYWTADGDGSSVNTRVQAAGASTTLNVDFLIVEEVTGVTASATTKTIHIASIAADVTAVEASAASKSTHVATVAADVTKAFASAQGKNVHIATVAAEITPVEAAAAATWTAGFNTYQATVAADAPTVEASAAAKSVHVASVDASISTLGPEHVIDPTIHSDNWTVYIGTGTPNGDGTCTFTGSGGRCYEDGNFVESGKVYEVTFTVTGLTGGYVGGWFQGLGPILGPDIETNGTHVQRVTTGTVGPLAFGFFGPATVSNVSIKKVVGVQASASTKTTHIATVSADTPAAEASAAAKSIHIASVAATTAKVFASNESRFTHYVTVAAVAPTVEASADAKVIHKATVAADAPTVEASAASKANHIAAVAAETDTVTASASSRGKVVATVDAEVPTVTAAAQGKVTHIATVAAEVPTVEASAVSKVKHIATVDADVTAVTASLFAKGLEATFIHADVSKVTASAASKVIHKATVAADVSAVTASATTHYVRKAAVDADTPTVEASATTHYVRTAAVDADVPTIEASAAAKSRHTASVSADVKAVEASASTKANRIATVAADVLTVTASAASKSVHIASVAAVTAEVFASNESGISHYATVAAVTPVTTASADTKTTHKATVAADVPTVEASASNKITHIASVSAEIAPVTAFVTSAGLIVATVNADVSTVEAAAAAKVTHKATVAADVPTVEASATTHYVRTAAVAADVSTITSSATARALLKASVNADIATVEASAASKSVHVATVGAEILPVTASASTSGLLKATVDADVSQVEASAATKVIHKATVAAEIQAIEASAAAKGIHKAIVAADVPVTEAALSSRRLIKAAVNAVTAEVFASNESGISHYAYIVALTPVVEASASTKTKHISQVDADTPVVEASAAAKVTHKASVNAEITPVEASGYLSRGQKLARIDAEVPTVTASADVKVIHKATVAAETSQVEASASTRALRVAVIAAEISPVEASASLVKVTPKAAVAADVNTVEASASTKVYHKATVDAFTANVTASLAAKVTHKATVAAVITPVEASVITRAGAKAVTVDASVQDTEASISAKVVHKASVSADISSVTASGSMRPYKRVARINAEVAVVEASAIVRIYGVFDPNAVNPCSTWTLKAMPTTWVLGARPTTWIIKCRDTLYRLSCK